MSTWMENLKEKAKKTAEVVWKNKGKIALGAAGIGVGIFLAKRPKNDDRMQGEYELNSPRYPDAEDPAVGKDIIMRFFDEDGNQYKDDIRCTQLFADDWFEIRDA